jgi:EmrB/QacA subfamily drug resistance transporter
VATLAFFLVVADMSAVNTGFPSMVAELGGSTSTTSWVVSGYNVTVGALLLSAGRLADSIGRKRVFVPGVAVFLAGSVAAGAAPGVGWLIGARLVQGTGAAAIAATSLAVVLPGVPHHRRSLAVGIAAAVGSLGAVAGPALGSLVIEMWSWRGIFLLNLPVGVVTLALAPRLLIESKDPDASGRIDLPGVIAGTVAVAAVMLAIVTSAGDGVGTGWPAGLMMVGLVSTVALVRRSRRHPEPMIDVELMRMPSFRSANVAAAAWSLGFASGFLANSLFLQQRWQLPMVTVGKVLVVSPVVAAVVSPLAGRLADRFGHRWILAAGSMICGAGYLALRFTIGAEPQVWTRFAPVTAVIGVGVGITVAGWPAAALSDVDHRRLGTAEATVRTTQQVGYALGIAIVVTVLSEADAGELSSSLAAGLAAHRTAWSFIGLMFGCATLVIAATFPSGRARRQAASLVA